MPKLVRTITYIGPQKWLDMCVDNSFVALKQELGNGKSITSQWRDVKAHRRAQQIDDAKRRRVFTGSKAIPQPKRTHAIREAHEDND